MNIFSPLNRYSGRSNLGRVAAMFALMACATLSWSLWAQAAGVEFQIPKPYAAPAGYTVTGSTVKNEQSEPSIGYWDGSVVNWGPALQAETVCFTDVGYIIQCFKGTPF